MKTSAQVATLVMGLAIAVAGATGASADSQWQTHHPRREQLNDRLASQNHRIATERREGEMTRGQAHRLHAEDRSIRNQERVLASRHDGHLTQSEQHRLNQEENKISHQISG